MIRSTSLIVRGSWSSPAMRLAAAARGLTPTASVLIVASALAGPIAPAAGPVGDDAGLALGGPEFDFGDAPDGSPGCGIGGGIGMFPTVPGTPNATPGRDAPKHLVPAGAPFVLGGAITDEPAPYLPPCDWLTPGCDDPVPLFVSDDAPFLLCLDPLCLSGVTVSAGVCGIGFGGAFGPSPGPAPLGFWLFAATRAPFSVGPAYVNVVSDHDLSGVYDDSAVGWCLKDAALPPNPTPAPVVSLFATVPFPVFTVTKLPFGFWAVDPFWNRFHVSPEAKVPVTGGFTWDGSGTLPAYPVGETEDWVPESDPGEWSCGLPRYNFDTVGTIIVSLDPTDTTCSRGVPVPVSSIGMPSGVMREFRPGPYFDGARFATEMMALSLQGVSPALAGPVIITEDPDVFSFGALTGIHVPGPGIPPTMHSFFDVFIHVDLPGLNLSLRTGAKPLRVQAGNQVMGLNTLAPYRTPQNAPVPLVDRATGQPRGWVCHADLSVHNFTEWHCPGDANGDRQVNFGDITAELSNWNRGGPAGDANQTCRVDFNDITTTLANWGRACRQ